MSDLFNIETKSETLEVKTSVRLLSIKIGSDNFKADYQHFFVFPDGSEIKKADRPVDRSIDTFKDEGIDYNGTQITLTDFIRIGALLSEKWRAEDEAKPVDGGLGGVGAVTPP